jgi:hypothetical protein
MTNKVVRYIQDETIKRIDRFKEAAENHLLKTYSRMAVIAADSKVDAKGLIGMFSHSGDRFTDKEIKNITIDYDLNLLSLIYQVSKIMSMSYFQNDFTVGLHLSMEVKRNRTLVYPSINVRGYRDILLEYLIDWYAQNQSDPPDETEVPARQWKMRCKDWWEFDEVQGFKLKIDLFHPDDMYSINKTLRGEKLTEGIIKNVIRDEVRIKDIAEAAIINAEMLKLSKEEREEKGISKYMNLRDYYLRNPEGIQIINNYIKDNNVTVTPITKELLMEKGRFGAEKIEDKYVDLLDRQPEIEM